MAIPILPGTRFFRLVVLSHDGGKDALVRCDCGTERTMLRINLTNGNSKSCGCARRETLGNLRRTHGRSGTRPYRIWCLMRGRCLRPSNPNWPDYGGRGIAICEEWGDFAIFLAWAMANGYSDDLTIERKDNDGPYSPENCKWATRAEQTANRRNTVFIRYRGVMLTLSEVARLTGKTPSYFYWKLRSGVSPERAARGL